MVKLSPEIKAVMQPADALDQVWRPRPLSTLSPAAQKLLAIEDEQVDDEGYPLAPDYLLPALEAAVWLIPSRYFFRTDDDLKRVLRVLSFAYQQGRQDALTGGG